jgi:phage shock protein E
MSPETRTMRRSRLALALIAVVVAAFGVAACGSDSDSGEPSPGEEAAAAALESDRAVIDVRTPQEYDAGHVEGAELIDIQGPDFSTQVAALDTEGEYVVYCRSGNRSAAAAAQMQAAGLDVLDGGGLDDMVAAGWPEAG